mgnify:FL=1
MATTFEAQCLVSILESVGCVLVKDILFGVFELAILLNIVELVLLSQFVSLYSYIHFD